jgi:hypothetical protein
MPAHIAGMTKPLEYYPRQGRGPRYISAARLYAVLRMKLGCVDMGWRDQESWYWVTPNGVPFRVADPAMDPNCRAVLGTDARRELCFPYQYARELLAKVSEMIAMPASRPLGQNLPPLALA